MRGQCARCDAEVEAVFQHPRLRRVLRGYLLLPLPFVPVLPIIASDYVVMIPMLMVYMLGLGPVFAIIQEAPTCAGCGANLERPPRSAMARLLGY
ncbi:MAG: hypothetical protein KDK70_13940 [Myxococcales bacterium]|nr:hypothetical protein [Myxococcales bacterium]